MDPLNSFFLQLGQQVTVRFVTGTVYIEFVRQPSQEAIAICRRIANMPGFKRLAHYKSNWEADEVRWLFELPMNYPRVPFAKALLETFREMEITGSVRFDGNFEDDPSIYFETKFNHDVVKTLEDLQKYA